MGEIRSFTSIASDGLAWLGRDPLADLQAADSQDARRCREKLPSVTDALLRQYNWNFANRFADLAGEALITKPFGYTYRFTLPAGGGLDYCLRVLRVQGQPKWQVGGRFIYAAQNPPLRIQYVGRPQDPDDYDPLFAKVLAIDLAFELINLVPADEIRKRTREMREARNDMMRQARLTDAVEGHVDKLDIETSSWLAARRPM